MAPRYFDINAKGHSIKCKIYCDNIRELQKIVVFAHGFGGHKDNKAAERFAETIMSKVKKVGVITFDLPAHGSDVKKKITLEDCYLYFDLLLEYIKEQMKIETIYMYATSFGGFLTLNYIQQRGNPFCKIALRCPAICMYDAMAGRILTDENKELLEKGKDVLAGFDRKIKLDKAFMDEIQSIDLMQMDFIDFADDMLIIHGTNDEIIPIDRVREFSENNVIEFIEVEGADHRFKDVSMMLLAHSKIINFYMGN